MQMNRIEKIEQAASHKSYTYTKKCRIHHPGKENVFNIKSKITQAD
jgi:hypothetical protein